MHCFQGVHCTIALERVASSAVVVTFTGTDVGELGDAPFMVLDALLTGEPVDLFIDARAGRAAAVEVSNDWAQWLRRHRGRLRRVHMLTANRFVALSADLVRRFAELGEAMRLYTDPAAFDAELAAMVLTEVADPRLSATSAPGPRDRRADADR